MSHKQNDIWLEAANDAFQDALECGNYALVKDIIADTFDAGFPDVARAMTSKLRSCPINHFAVPTPYVS